MAHLAWDEVYLGVDEVVVRVAVGTVHTSGVLEEVFVTASLWKEHISRCL